MFQATRDTHRVTQRKIEFSNRPKQTNTPYTSAQHAFQVVACAIRGMINRRCTARQMRTNERTPHVAQISNRIIAQAKKSETKAKTRSVRRTHIDERFAALIKRQTHRHQQLALANNQSIAEPRRRSMRRKGANDKSDARNERTKQTSRNVPSCSTPFSFQT